MKQNRPGILAVRAVNQYRRYDVLTYLGLRYYLENSAARTDQWAKQVATDLVLTRSHLPYFRTYHFKEATINGGIENRPIYLPCANEALAESALLEECAKHPQAFSNQSCVFSYQLNREENRSGIFVHYFEGLHARHKAIADACETYPDGVVQYIDIKKFYPSISTGMAISAWRQHSENADLLPRFRELGEKLVYDHGQIVRKNEKGILTGPMFGHFIGNLVFQELDEEFTSSLPAEYFRYVDDITLVGDLDAVEKSLKIIRERLDQVGFVLHDISSPKSIRESSDEWLKGRDDYQVDQNSASWMQFIGNLKRFLFYMPKERENLKNAFRDEGYRIPVRDYSIMARDRNFIGHISYWAKSSWFRSKLHAITIKSLLDQARTLRNSYEMEYRNLVDGANSLSGFERKRRVTKLRFHAGRLIYLATDDTLSSLWPLASGVPELHLHVKIMESMVSGKIDSLLALGSNAAQAAAQPLKAAAKECTTVLQRLPEAEELALAVFILNGLPVKRLEPLLTGESELMRFAVNGADPSLMKSVSPFIQEVACLHGIAEKPRHSELLEIAFDADEEFALDALDQLDSVLSP